MARRLEENTAIGSPEVGTRVRVVNSGCKYNAKDFEKAATFEAYKGEYEDAVKNDTLGLIVQKAKHFKKETMEVFLIKFDNNKAAIMARKGFDVPLFLGCGIQIANQGSSTRPRTSRTRRGTRTSAWSTRSSRVSGAC